MTDPIEKISQAKNKFEDKREEEQKRWKKIKQEHRDKKDNIDQEYKEQLRQITVNELGQIHTQHSHVKDRLETIDSLKDDLEEIFYKSINTYVDGKRVTGGREVTVKEDGVHRYGHSKYSEISISKLFGRYENSLDKAMKKTDHYTEFKELMQQMNKVNIGSGNKFDAEKELENNITFNEKEINKLEYRPAWSKVTIHYLSERGDQQSLEIPINQSFDRPHRSRNRYARNLKLLTKVKQPLLQLVEQVKEEADRRIETRREVKQEVSKPASEKLVAERL